jgi:hypothetical protein
VAVAVAVDGVARLRRDALLVIVVVGIGRRLESTVDHLVVRANRS